MNVEFVKPPCQCPEVWLDRDGGRMPLPAPARLRHSCSYTLARRALIPEVWKRTLAEASERGISRSSRETFDHWVTRRFIQAMDQATEAAGYFRSLNGGAPR